MNFSQQLTEAIKTAESGVLPVDVNKQRKILGDVERAANQAMNGLINVTKTLEMFKNNEVIIPIIKQIEEMTNGFKKGGAIRQTLENIAMLPQIKE